MLNVTESAKDYLHDLVDRAEAENAAVRFVMRDNGINVIIDEEKPEDVSVTHNDKTVLVMSEDVANAIGERTLDVQQSQSGPALALA